MISSLIDPLTPPSMLTTLTRSSTDASAEKEPETLLMITAIAGAELCAGELARSTSHAVEIAGSRKLGLAALRRGDYAAVIMDECILESDHAAADLLWKSCGRAIPLQVNFALLGCSRLCREVKAALARREQEQALALTAAASSLQNELRSITAGLLLHSELALSEPALPPQSTVKLKLLVELAGALCRQLEQPRV